MGGGGIIVSAEGNSLVGGVWGYPPQKIFKFGGSKMLFSALVMRYVSENRPQILLQVTIIKITESKENKSIHRLDLSGSTGPGGGSCPLAPLPPLLATALIGLVKIKQDANILQLTK